MLLPLPVPLFQVVVPLLQQLPDCERGSWKANSVLHSYCTVTLQLHSYTTATLQLHYSYTTVTQQLHSWHQFNIPWWKILLSVVTTDLVRKLGHYDDVTVRPVTVLHRPSLPQETVTHSFSNSNKSGEPENVFFSFSLCSSSGGFRSCYWSDRPLCLTSFCLS